MGIEQELRESRLRELGEQKAAELLPEIEKISDRLSVRYNREIVDSVSWRIKSAESIEKKLRKKKKPVTLASAVKSLHDIIGIRVVCSFQDDVFRMAAALRQLPGFTFIKEKNYITHPKASGYRSIHMIGQCVLADGREFPMEIQVRSVAMNYWAILDHQLCYKNEKKEVRELRRELKSYAIEIAEIDKKFYKMRKKIEKL